MDAVVDKFAQHHGDAQYYQYGKDTSLHVTYRNPEVVKALSAALTGCTQQGAIILHFCLVDDAGAQIPKSPELRRDAARKTTRIKFSTVDEKGRVRPAAASIALQRFDCFLVAGREPLVDGEIALRTVARTEFTPEGLRLCFKLQIAVTSKTHAEGRPLQIRMSLQHTGKESVTLVPTTGPVPFLTEPPPNSLVEVITDGRPGDQMLLIGAPLRSSRSQNTDVTVELCDGAKSWLLLRSQKKCRDFPQMFVTRVPLAISPRTYQIRISSLPTDFANLSEISISQIIHPKPTLAQSATLLENEVLQHKSSRALSPQCANVPVSLRPCTNEKRQYIPMQPEGLGTPSNPKRRKMHVSSQVPVHPRQEEAEGSEVETGQGVDNEMNDQLRYTHSTFDRAQTSGSDEHIEPMAKCEEHGGVMNADLRIGRIDSTQSLIHDLQAYFGGDDSFGLPQV